MQQAFADLLFPFLFHRIMHNEWWFDDYALAIWVTVQSTSEMASKMASEMGQRGYLVASLYCVRSSVKRQNFKVVMQQNRTFVWHDQLSVSAVSSQELQSVTLSQKDLIWVSERANVVVCSSKVDKGDHVAVRSMPYARHTLVGQTVCACLL